MIAYYKRSLSKLKLIKNYLSSYLGKVNLENFIAKFAYIKARKIKFIVI